MNFSVSRPTKLQFKFQFAPKVRNWQIKSCSFRAISVTVKCNIAHSVFSRNCYVRRAMMTTDQKRRWADQHKLWRPSTGTVPHGITEWSSEKPRSREAGQHSAAYSSFSCLVWLVVLVHYIHWPSFTGRSSIDQCRRQTLHFQTPEHWEVISHSDICMFGFSCFAVTVILAFCIITSVVTNKW